MPQDNEIAFESDERLLFKKSVNPDFSTKQNIFSKAEQEIKVLPDKQKLKCINQTCKTGTVISWSQEERLQNNEYTQK